MLSTTLVGASVNAAAWVSAMELDEENDLAFLGTYSQHIHIYDVSVATNPRLLHTLEGHTGSVRCLQYRPAERYLFSGGFDAWCGVWSIVHGATPEAVQRSRSAGWLKEGANQKVKSVVFVPPTAGASTAGNSNGSQGLVVIGQDAGYMCFFCVSTGKMKFALKAHVNTVVRLVYIEEAHVLISAGLDGVVKFWSIPMEATSGEAPAANIVTVAASSTAASSSSSAAAAAEGDNDDVSESMDAVSLSTSSDAGIGRGNFTGASSSQADSEAFARRKNSTLGPSAPPPSLATSVPAIHKTSRADSTDGTTVSCFATCSAKMTHARSEHRRLFMREDLT